MKFKYLSISLFVSIATLCSSQTVTNFVVHSNWFRDQGGDKEYFRTQVLPTLVNLEYSDQFSITNGTVYVDTSIFPDPTEVNLLKLRIEQVNTILTNSVEELTGDITYIRDDINDINNSITSLVSRVSTNEVSISEINTRLDNLTNSLHQVAFTGDYNDLTNKPAISDPLFNGEIVDKNFVITNTIDSVQFASHLEEFHDDDKVVTKEVPGTKFDGKSFTTFTKEYNSGSFEDVLVTNKFKLPHIPYSYGESYEDTLVINRQLSNFLTGSHDDNRLYPNKPLYYEGDSASIIYYYLDNYELLFNNDITDSTSYQAGKLINNDNTYYLPNSHGTATNLNVIATKQDIEDRAITVNKLYGNYVVSDKIPILITKKNPQAFLEPHGVSLYDSKIKITDTQSYNIFTNLTIDPYYILRYGSHYGKIINEYPEVSGRLAVVDQIPSIEGLATTDYVDSHNWAWDSITNPPTKLSDFTDDILNGKNISVSSITSRGDITSHGDINIFDVGSLVIDHDAFADDFVNFHCTSRAQDIYGDGGFSISYNSEPYGFWKINVINYGIDSEHASTLILPYEDGMLATTNYVDNHEFSWSNIINPPTKLSDFINDLNFDDKYLKLTGGTITGGLTISTGNISTNNCLSVGVNNSVSGNGAVAFGNNATATQSSFSHGYLTKATANNSHAEGQGTEATSARSHAEGYYTKASGSGSHAEGNNTESRGSYSYAGGYNSLATNNYTYVWSGIPPDQVYNEDEFSYNVYSNDLTRLSINPYGSHGQGTYSINPVGGVEGFYIGENNLSNIVVSISPQVKKYDESTNPNGYLTYDDFINLLDKSMTTGIRVGDKIYKVVAQEYEGD